MVDLGFLLITFFILTTTWSKPKSLKLLLPAGKDNTTVYGETTALTLIPLAGDKLFFYNGRLDDAIQKKSYGLIPANGLRNVITQKQLALDANPKFNRNDLSLIIKPTDQSNLRNIMETLDEVLINDLRHYAFVDLSPEEMKWLIQKKLMN